jgi:hypothetical protein
MKQNGRSNAIIWRPSPGKSWRILFNEVFSLVPPPPLASVYQSFLDPTPDFHGRREDECGVQESNGVQTTVFFYCFPHAGGNPSRGHLHFVVCVRRRLKLHQVRSIERLEQVGKNAALVKVFENRRQLPIRRVEQERTRTLSIAALGSPRRASAN